MEGDTQKDLVLTEARAAVVREYLVENFGFDDSTLKTLGMGKQADAKSDPGWGTVQILIYPVGTEIPPNKQTPAGMPSKTAPDQPVQSSGVPVPATTLGSSIGELETAAIVQPNYGGKQL